jgi:glycosyltransferase involved in cell wall biosynthesis
MEYVKRADVCVSPFCPSPILDSTSPTKLVEYLAMEKAAVVKDHPDQRQVIENSGGGICVPYEEEAFANAIVRLLRDPGLARKMGSQGRVYVEKYRDYKCIADMVEARYFQIMSDKSIY